MSRDQIKYDEVSQALSGARLGTYLRYSKNDVAGAFQLHHVNAQLAASFWEPLELFEVVLRNRLADCLTQTFGSNWPVQPVFAKVITKEARSRECVIFRVQGKFIGGAEQFAPLLF